MINTSKIDSNISNNEIIKRLPIGKKVISKDMVFAISNFNEIFTQWRKIFIRALILLYFN